MRVYPLWSITIFWMLTGIGIGMGVGADTLKPLNSEGEPGNPLAPTEAVKRMKQALPALQDGYAAVKTDADYKTFRESEAWREFRTEAARLRSVDLKALDTPAAKTAFWVNLYNILVADGIASLRVKGSVRKTPDFFQRAAYNVGGIVFSLEQIEHGLLRANRPPLKGAKPVLKANDPRLEFGVKTVDPRLHFALNCGARSCPPVSVYEATQLDAQLDSAARNFVNGPDVRVDTTLNRVQISQIFQWYEPDFGGNRVGILQFLSQHLQNPTARNHLVLNQATTTIQYLPYDWALAEHNP